ncbi:MAG: hypothetical protein NVSMB19_19130 [Vulcanimicrobiaceae bacterium]
MISNLSPVVLLIGTAVAVSLGIFTYTLIPAKTELAKRLERVEAMPWDQTPRRSDAFEKIFNDEQRGRLRRQLDEAGWYTVTPAKIAFQMIASTVLFTALGIAFVTYAKGSFISYVVAVVLAALGALSPRSKLASAVKKRKIEIQKTLPDFLDMLVSTVAAGLAFTAALAYAQDVATGPLGEEIKAALSEVRLGRSRADALRAMANRVNQEQLTNFIMAVIQAEALGSNLSLVLSELAEDVRNRRMTRAEELANLMPTKMALPMALFMLPALFLMIFGGIIAQYLERPP